MKVTNTVELITLTLAGDKHAYGQLVRLHQNAIRSYIAKQTKQCHEVDDLAQEAFITAYKNLEKLKDPITFQAWLYGISLNVVRNHRRKFSPTAAGNESELDLFISQELEEQLLENDEDVSLNALSSCKNKLSSEHQQLLRLHYDEKQNIKALTARFNCKLSTITMRLHRIKNALKQCIADKLARDML